ncbi:hypothetical protein [Streptomyces sp.]|uniref:hypothetical protein n=1 Tax=Streptomyces sp. TaxID=1931 RepID=UPI002D282AD5|nr:hypothetical protein [Streptomyces sp.]HZF90424.1 hypothetical protein [Streptomyces sp.]
MDLVTFAAARTATQHFGIMVEGAPFTICRTSACNLAPLDEAGEGPICQTCTRGAAVLRSRVLRPEVRLLATARSATAAGHYLIEAEGESVAYCGKQLGEATPKNTRVCKPCESLRSAVAAFDQERLSEQCGYAVDAERPIECADCDWVGRYVEDSPKGKAEWRRHFYEECGADMEDEAGEQPRVEDVVGTWREEWFTAGQQVLDGLLDEQGALFA